MMRDNRLNYILVGSFVLTMILALILALALLTGRTGSSDEYFTRFTDVSGLKYGSKVFYMGYPVGQVQSINPVLKDGRLGFEITMEISRDFAAWQVPADSIARVKASGLLAAITIDIRAGESKESIKPGGWVTGQEKTDVMDAVAQTADTVRNITMTSLKPLLFNLNRYVGSFGLILEQKGGPLIENLSRLSAQLSDRSPEIINNFLQTSTQIRKASERLTLILSDKNSGEVGTVLEHVLQASTELARLTRKANSRFDELMNPQLIGQIHSAAGNFLVTSKDLRELSRNSKDRLAQVLSRNNLRHLDNTLANLERTSVNLSSVVDTKQVDSIHEAVSKFREAAEQIRMLIGDSRRQLGNLLGPSTAHRVDSTLDNISTASRSITDLSVGLKLRVDEILTPQIAIGIKQALKNFAEAAQGIAHLSAGLDVSRVRLESVLAQLDDSAKENRAPVRESIRSVRYSLAIVAEHIDAVSRNLEGTSRNMVEFSRLIKANPGMLLRNPVPPRDSPITATGDAKGG